MHNRFDILSVIWAAAVLFTAAPDFAMAENSASRLPGIGSPADRIYSINKEINLGERVMHSIAAQDALLDDALINDYIQQLGYRLSSGVFDEEPFDRLFPHFNVIDFPAINAFAVPGGHIAVFTGLFAASESESELCSVIAHEIAHVRLRHYAQTLLKGREDLSLSIFGVIAGILATIANPFAGSAVLISTLAGTAQQQLKHSRQHEYEADVFGYQYLKNADYNPKGMIEFHRRLLRLASQNQNIEYLRTHPVSTNRISEIASRIAEETTLKSNFWSNTGRDEKIFHLMKARLLVHKSVERYASLLRQKNDPEIKKYHEAMRAMVEEDYFGAQTMLQSLAELDPENAVYLFSLAEALNAQELYAESTEQIDRLLTIYPRMSPALLLAAGNALQQKQAHQAFRYLRKTDQTYLPYANNLKRLDFLSEAYYQSNDLVNHYLAKADAEFLRGNYRDSFYFMSSAINNRYINAEKKARVQKLLDERLAFTSDKGRRR